jgi:hypothetical protein
MDELGASGSIAGVRPAYGAPFLTTHRAVAVCARELIHLTEEIVAAVTALRDSLGVEKEVVRKPPGRCMVQLGPVALTAVWLRGNADSIASGQLLVNVWEGNVAPPIDHSWERSGRERNSQPARLVWEMVLVASADAESSWAWIPSVADSAPISASQLASTCAEQLRAAYLAAVPATAAGSQ